MVTLIHLYSFAFLTASLCRALELSAKWEQSLQLLSHKRFLRATHQHLAVMAFSLSGDPREHGDGRLQARVHVGGKPGPLAEHAQDGAGTLGGSLEHCPWRIAGGIRPSQETTQKRVAIPCNSMQILFLIGY